MSLVGLPLFDSADRCVLTVADKPSARPALQSPAWIAKYGTKFTTVPEWKPAEDTEMAKQTVDGPATFATEKDVADVTAAAEVIKAYLRRELIVEKCRTSPCFGCVSCNAVDLERRLDALLGLF